MKYKLSEILNQYKNDFYSYEPSDKHFSEFEDKLNGLKKEKKIIFSILKYAAAIILLITVSLSVYVIRLQKISNNVSVFYENKELIETEEYYQALLNKKYKELDILTRKTNIISSLEIKRDLREFNRDIRSLKEDWEENPGDERIANTVISSYILQLETLDHIISLSKKNLT